MCNNEVSNKVFDTLLEFLRELVFNEKRVTRVISRHEKYYCSLEICIEINRCMSR